MCYSTVTNLWRYCSTIVFYSPINESDFFSLSLYFLCFSSPLLFSITTSLSHHISLSRWAYSGMGSAWVAQAHQWWAMIHGDDGLLKLSENGMGFVCCVLLSVNLGFAQQECFFNIWVLCVMFWSGLIWVLLNNCLGFDRGWFGFFWVFFFLIWV